MVSLIEKKYLVTQIETLLTIAKFLAFDFLLFCSRPTWGFHPNITLEGAIQLLLEKGKHGSYICRRSEKVQDEYRLSVRYVVILFSAATFIL